MSSTLYWIDVAFYISGGLCAAMGLQRLWRGRMRFVQVETGPTEPFPVELIAIPVAVYFLAIGAVQWFVLPGPGQEVENPRTLQAHANNLVQLCGILACIWSAARMPGGGGIKGYFFGRGNWAKWTGAALGWWLTSLGLCALTLWITEAAIAFLWPGETPDAHATLQALSAESPSLLDRISLYLGALLIAPLAEECFFRGLLQPAFASVTRRRASAIVLAALAFGMIHLGQGHAVPALVVLGLVLGLAYEWSGSLMVPICVHVLFNARTLVWHAFGAMAGGG